MVIRERKPVYLVKREHYAQFKSCCVDRDTLPDDYDAFLLQRMRYEKSVRTAGRIPIRVYIIPSDFMNWCAGAGWTTTEESRERYADFLLSKNGK